MGLWSFGRDSDIGFVTRVVSAFAADGVKLRGKLTLIFRGPRPRGIADAAADACTVIAASLIAEAHDHRKLIGNEPALVVKLQQRLPEDFTPCRAIELVALHVVGGELAPATDAKLVPPAAKSAPEGARSKAEPAATSAPKGAPVLSPARGPAPSPRNPPGTARSAPEASGRVPQASARIEQATSGRAPQASARIEQAVSGRGPQISSRIEPAASGRGPQISSRIEPAASPRIHPASAARGGGHAPRFSLQLSAAVRRRTPAPIGLPGQPSSRGAASEKRKSNPAQQPATEARREKRSASSPRTAAAASPPAASAQRAQPAPAAPAAQPARAERTRNETPRTETRNESPRNGPNSKRATGPNSRRGSQRSAPAKPSALPKRAAAWQAALALVSESASLEDLRAPLGAMLRDGAARLALVLLLAADQPSFDVMSTLDAESPAADREDVARLAREASAAVASFFYIELLQAGLPQNFAIDALQVLGDALPGGGLPVAQMTRYLGAVDVGVELANAAATIFEAPGDGEALGAAMTATIEELRVRLRQAARVVTSSAGL